MSHRIPTFSSISSTTLLRTALGLLRPDQLHSIIIYCCLVQTAFVVCTLDGFAFAVDYRTWFYDTKACRFHFNYLEFYLSPLVTNFEAVAFSDRSISLTKVVDKQFNNGTRKAYDGVGERTDCNTLDLLRQLVSYWRSSFTKTYRADIWVWANGDDMANLNVETISADTVYACTFVIQLPINKDG